MMSVKPQQITFQLITKAPGSGCDKIEITYGDRIRDPKKLNAKPPVFLYKTYKVVYECKA